MSGDRRRRSGFKRPKNHSKARATEEYQRDIATLQDENARLRRMLYAPVGGEALFLMNSGADDRLALIQYLWKGDFGDCASEIVSSDNELIDIFRMKTLNQHDRRSSNLSDCRKDTRLNFMAGMLCRNQNVHTLPKQQAILAVTAKAKHVNNEFWEVLTALRLLPSYKWTGLLVTDALAHDPGPPYEVVEWVSAAVFDNNTIQCNYTARHNADTQGQRLDMTNWATLWLPR